MSGFRPQVWCTFYEEGHLPLKTSSNVMQDYPYVFGTSNPNLLYFFFPLKVTLKCELWIQARYQNILSQCFFLAFLLIDL